MILSENTKEKVGEVEVVSPAIDLDQDFINSVQSVFNPIIITDNPKVEVYRSIIRKSNELGISCRQVIRACFDIRETNLNQSKEYNAFRVWVAGIYVMRTVAEIKRRLLLEGIDKLPLL